MSDGEYRFGRVVAPEDAYAPQFFSDGESAEDLEGEDHPDGMEIVTEDPDGPTPEGRVEKEDLLSEARDKLDAALESNAPITDPEIIKTLFGGHRR